MFTTSNRHGIAALAAVLVVSLAAVAPAGAVGDDDAANETVVDALSDGADATANDVGVTNTTPVSAAAPPGDTEGDSAANDGAATADAAVDDKGGTTTAAAGPSTAADGRDGVSANDGRGETTAAAVEAAIAGAEAFAVERTPGGGTGGVDGRTADGPSAPTVGVTTTLGSADAGAARVGGFLLLLDRVDESRLQGADDAEPAAGPREVRADDGATRFDRAPVLAVHSLGGAAAGAGSVPVPSVPTAGLAVGVGAAAALVTRQGVLLADALRSVGAAVGVAPVALRETSLLDRLVRMFYLLRYSRYDDSDPLDHEGRARVFAVVEESPGAYLSEVSDRADIPLSTARHHIRVLEREELVSGAKVRGKRRFYPAHVEQVELAAALNDRPTASLLDALARLGVASVSDLAGELDRDPSTVSHHLQRLAEDDLVVRERDGRAVMNRLSQEVHTVLAGDVDQESADATEAVASGAH